MGIEDRVKSGAADFSRSSILNPRSVVITGASSGIGLALARHYLERGATVAAFARRGDLLQTLAAEFPNKVFCYALDVRDAPAIQQAASDFMARAGVPDIVIANAGVSRGTLTEYVEDEEVFQNVMDINVLGMVKTFQPFLVAMREAALSPQPLSQEGEGGTSRWSGLPAWRAFAGFRARVPTRRPKRRRSPIWKVCASKCMAAG